MTLPPNSSCPQILSSFEFVSGVGFATDGRVERRALARSLWACAARATARIEGVCELVRGSAIRCVSEGARRCSRRGTAQGPGALPSGVNSITFSSSSRRRPLKALSGMIYSVPPMDGLTKRVRLGSSGPRGTGCTQVRAGRRMQTNREFEHVIWPPL